MWNFIAIKVAGLVIVTELLRWLRPLYTYAILVAQLITLGYLLYGTT